MGGPTPVRIANNGTPESPFKERLDKPTGLYNFRQKTGKLTKFFRPIVN
jgi:hypothetical protein